MQDVVVGFLVSFELDLLVYRRRYPTKERDDGGFRLVSKRRIGPGCCAKTSVIAWNCTETRAIVTFIESIDDNNQRC